MNNQKVLLDHHLSNVRQYDYLGFYMRSSNIQIYITYIYMNNYKLTLATGNPHLADKRRLNSLINPSADMIIRY
jgi:hypothetical protein